MTGPVSVPVPPENPEPLPDDTPVSPVPLDVTPPADDPGALYLLTGPGTWRWAAIAPNGALSAVGVCWPTQELATQDRLLAADQLSLPISDELPPEHQTVDTWLAMTATPDNAPPFPPDPQP